MTIQTPQLALPPAPRTKLVFLGTGNPNPVPNHQGPCAAVIVDDYVYLVDCGPGLVRQASAARLKGVAALTMDHLTKAFITHLHSDHTLGLPDLMMTPAVTGRTEGLQVWGPPGLSAMVEHINKAYSVDHEIRFHGGEPAIPEAYKVTVHEIRQGVVYSDERVKVTAFNVKHGKLKYAFGYRFETPDRVIVFSGDTTYCPNIIEYARGCDILVHEVYSEAALKKRTPKWQHYHSTYHTSGPDVGRIASAVKPKLLILNHELPFTAAPGEILQEVESQYGGPVVEAQDLDVY